EINPNNDRSYYNRGIAKGYLGDEKGATEDCTKAIEMRSNRKETSQNKGKPRPMML
ncbi:MAG: tetratricopeptide repeat protein, partial [Aureispira sp.]|nr:tetratricopeptide repeat protein [Aureispira sp.]